MINPYIQTVIGTLAVDGWAVIFCTTRTGETAWGRSSYRTLIAVPNVTAYPSTASVPIAVLLYNGPLLCGFNVPIIL